MTQLATTNGHAGASPALWDAEQRTTLKSVLCPGISDAELTLYAEVCRNTGLDPFTKQIYWIRGKGPITGIDGYRSIAERTGQLAGSQTYWCGSDGAWQEVWLSDTAPAAAKTVIYRKGCAQPFVGVARFKEYSTGQNLWQKMPAVMIGKVSEAVTLRKAFPRDIGGVYTREEMEQAGPEYVDVPPSEFADAEAPALPPPIPAYTITRTPSAEPLGNDDPIPPLDQRPPTPAQRVQHSAQQRQASIAAGEYPVGVPITVDALFIKRGATPGGKAKASVKTETKGTTHWLTIWGEDFDQLRLVTGRDDFENYTGPLRVTLDEFRKGDQVYYTARNINFAGITAETAAQILDGEYEEVEDDSQGPAWLEMPEFNDMPPLSPGN